MYNVTNSSNVSVFVSYKIFDNMTYFSKKLWKIR